MPCKLELSQQTNSIRNEDDLSDWVRLTMFESLLYPWSPIQCYEAIFSAYRHQPGHRVECETAWLVRVSMSICLRSILYITFDRIYRGKALKST